MNQFYLTAYGKKGEHLINEVVKASNDEEAKKLALARLEEESLLNAPSRLVKSSGGLLHFHP
ncbi:hypothetical protein FLK61_28785 [Paenalkalicoccus suaedae]|uniref:Uncharacterized protein n=1 Tax=Paenalkalicoccus suaedae TaxID=2592382 RepID=A0A859FCE4_9BACI|nr:YhzD family protein [Paenalkalicoccus suaedae]QKS70737.1 hypothetical protein FLK61_28785 [Paenalkalicoccus suaedae]